MPIVGELRKRKLAARGKVLVSSLVASVHLQGRVGDVNKAADACTVELDSSDACAEAVRTWLGDYLDDGYTEHVITKSRRDAIVMASFYLLWSRGALLNEWDVIKWAREGRE